MPDIAIENVVRVTLSVAEAGMSAKNVNAVALFTNDAPINLTDAYLIGKNVAAFASHFATGSLTMKMISAIFAQNKNVISGNGYLAVIPMRSTVSATPASASITVDSAQITALQAVTDGTLKITINGTVHNYGGMDFSGVQNIDDVKKILAANFSDAEITVSGTTMTFSTKTVGTTASIVLGAGTVVGSTDISTILDVQYATTVSGTNSSGETLVEAIGRTMSAVAYCGILSTAIEEDDKILENSTYIAGLKDCIYLNAWHSVKDIDGACATISGKSEKSTRCLCYGYGSYADAKVMSAAYAGRAFSTNFSGSNTSQTMNLKSLVGVSPDTTLTENDYAKAKAAGVDLYVNYNNGLPKVFSTGGNGFFDTVYENMALRFSVQANIFNALGTTATKIPQTETGMSVLRSAVAQSFIQFVNNGCLAAGTWTGSDTFGDPEVFRQNIEQKGWYVYSLPIKDQQQAEREQRIAPVVQGACKRAGAIHEADVILSVEN